MIKIGLIGTESMHGWSFAAACNIPDENGNYRYGTSRVTAVYGVDDNDEHINFSMEKGNIPVKANSMEELYEHCNAFMIIQRRGGEHMKYAEEIIKKGYPVFIDKPVCNTYEDIEKLEKLAKEYDNVICGGSGLKYNKQISELRDLINSGHFENIRGGTINHSADINCPFDGIFFYLPHAVEMMLELFGYEPKSLTTTVLTNDNFTVSVKYEDKIINLAINGCNPCYVVINGTKSISKEIDSSDIFINEVGHFIHCIEKNEIVKDVTKLTKHVKIILAVKESIETNKEVTL